MAMFYALAVLCLSGTVMSQMAGIGPCPNIKSMPTFEIAKIKGTWYEARRYLIPGQVHLKCVKSEFKISGKNDTLILDASAQSILTDTQSTINGLRVSASDPLVPGELEIKDPAGHKYSNYVILGTDYNSYLVGYSCINFKLANLKYVWILSRNKVISDASLDKALGVMKNQKLHTKTLVISDQSNCEVNRSSPDFSEKSVRKFNFLH